MSTRHVWLIKIGEPLPNENERLHRVGLIAELLSQRGHEVVWWTSTIDHQKKTFRFNKDSIINISNNYKIVLLHSLLYKKNFSIRRLINHRLIANLFFESALTCEVPDLILCSFPTIELSSAAIKYGKMKGVPVVIDVRDLWPDVFLNIVPSKLRWLVKYGLIGYYGKVKRIFKQCDSILAVSESYLNWALNYGERKKSGNDRIFTLGYKKPKTSIKELKKAKEYYSKMGVDSSKTIVWFVGTFGRSYDLGTIIKAANQVKYYKDLLFVFTGDGEKRSAWINQAAGLGNVIFTGWAKASQLTYLSEIADIGLMAYTRDATQGLPNKIFEYLSFGLPILSSLQSETKKLLSKHSVGYTYQPGDANSFINALMPLVENEAKRKEMGNRGKLLFEQKYSAHTVYSSMINLLEDLIKKNK